ncbi:unnamed protein product [Amoebophrya sp. A25]|nr:unnamed protein product [Amoebophrya sp. A25]|eukprot:GSA25T00022257001.1
MRPSSSRMRRGSMSGVLLLFLVSKKISGAFAREVYDPDPRPDDSGDPPPGADADHDDQLPTFLEATTGGSSTKNGTESSYNYNTMKNKTGGGKKQGLANAGPRMSDNDHYDNTSEEKKPSSNRVSNTKGKHHGMRANADEKHEKKVSMNWDTASQNNNRSRDAQHGDSNWSKVDHEYHEQANLTEDYQKSNTSRTETQPSFTYRDSHGEGNSSWSKVGHDYEQANLTADFYQDSNTRTEKEKQLSYTSDRPQPGDYYWLKGRDYEETNLTLAGDYEHSNTTERQLSFKRNIGKDVTLHTAESFGKGDVDRRRQKNEPVVDGDRHVADQDIDRLTDQTLTSSNTTGAVLVDTDIVIGPRWKQGGLSS